MEELPSALNYELSHDLHFDQFAGVAQQILENGKNAAEASTPTITTLDALANNEFLQKIGATILNSIQLKNHKIVESTHNSSETAMDLMFDTNHVILDSSSVNQLQQQLEYDKFMNEVWIGIVFTLILISMVFCICSCFLYHQFRTWKRNYRNNNNNVSGSQCTIIDIEALKLQPDLEDPVPEYTLVSGLPSYEAALELLHKSPQSSCLIVYPSVFNVFNKHEKASTELTIATTATLPATTIGAPTTRHSEAATPTQTQPQLCEATMPLLATTTTATPPNTPTIITTTGTTPTCENMKPPAPAANFVLQIVPSYAEVFGSYKTNDEKRTHSSKNPKQDSLTHKNQSDKC